MQLLPEPLRILKLLLYKNFLVRRRQFGWDLVSEVFIPVGFFFLIWISRDSTVGSPMQVSKDTYYPQQTRVQLIEKMAIYFYEHVEILYAPKTTFTMALMNAVNKTCFRDRAKLLAYKSEGELLSRYHEAIIHNEFWKAPVVIFDKSSLTHSTKHLKYKIRGKDLIARPSFEMFGHVVDFASVFSEETFFVQMQLCIDESFIRMKDSKFNANIFVQQVPYPSHTAYDPTEKSLRVALNEMLKFALMVPLFVETMKASTEKFLGVNVLMSMNGVSNGMNLFSWLITGVTFVGIFSILPIVLMMTSTLAGSLAYLHYGNAFIAFIFLIMNLTHSISYGYHISAYFSKPLFVVFAIVIANLIWWTVYNMTITEKTMFLTPYLGIMFPDFLFIRAIEQINYHEDTGEGVHWNNIFAVTDEKYGNAGSVGGVLLCTIFGIIVQFTLAVYVYEIHPGKYGAPKHPLYFLTFRKSKANTDDGMDNLELDSVDEKFFEPAKGANYEPGIQIRGLKKVYHLGLLMRTKVHALRGISADFYKGQITALLGENGAGKTTMMSILAGMQAPTEGKVFINSKDSKVHFREIINDMGLCTQENMLFPRLTVAEQLEFFAMLKGRGKDERVIRKNVGNLLFKFKLNSKQDCFPKELSGGQKRRVCLGMALVGDSNTLILDEPTSGSDPENRRIVWDVLLKMRGKKTILISTHDMEEADVLGDRIAILHNGELKSCGTSMYLKKSIGQNRVQVTLSVKPSSDAKAIIDALDGRVESTSQDGSKIVVSLPNSSQLPDSLDKLEGRKKELGISGLSVSLMSLQRVFLTVTQEDDDATRSSEPFISPPDKCTGILLAMQTIRALLAKKIIYTVKNWSTIVWQFVMLFLMVVFLGAILSFDISSVTGELIPISLEMYHKPVSYFQTFDENLGKKYTQLTRRFAGRSVQVKNSSLTVALINYAKSDLAQYNSHLIAAAEFNRTPIGLAVNALYSGNATYSFPISVNMLMNTLAKARLGDDYSISVSSQHIPALDDVLTAFVPLVTAYEAAILCAFILCPLMSFFVIHPAREARSSVKQLQTMSGASCFAYWSTMFLFDMLLALMLIALLLLLLADADSELELRLFEYNGMWISVLLYFLFAASSLPFVYVFSFLNKEPSSLVQLLSKLSWGLVCLDLIMQWIRWKLGRFTFVRGIRSVQKGLCLLVPWVSFLHGQISYYTTTQINARCAKLPNEFYDNQCYTSQHDRCCSFDCRDGECAWHEEYFNDFAGDVSLEESLLYLGATSLLYIGILVVLEYQWFQVLRAKMKRKVAPEPNSDEQVEQSKATISKRINGLREKHARNAESNTGDEGSSLSMDDNQVQFMVYELRKSYGQVKAVRDVSFAVRQKECFGLLGVNGAGKSTAFRMMTGAEVPDSGIMYMGDKDFKKHKRYVLSQMTYCPQHDALIESLNAYHHLRMFARLRGIPEKNVENEVETWIQRLNLTACASHPSRTYSGGNKRRLNIAIALIGIPNLVMLDEPTSGLDPGARHSLWNVIESCQITGQAVVLTSHSMEECEALCNRLAIMVDGRLVCIGTSPELRQRFGAGYDIKMKLNADKAAEQFDGIKADMQQSLQCEIADENVGHLMYHVSSENTSWRTMYNVMNAMKKKYDCIEDFSVLSSTLERLFLLFARGPIQNTTRNDNDQQQR